MNFQKMTPQKQRIDMFPLRSSRFPGFPLRTGILVLIMASLLALAMLSSFTPAAFGYEDEELAFLALINNHRQVNGLAPLTISPSLYNASEGHSYDMGVRNYFAHNTPEGITPWDRIRAAGYGYNTYLGENIAAGYVSAQSVFDAWLNSPGHNANMLSPNFRAVGIGRYYVPGSHYGYYWTTDFGGVSEDNSPPSVSITYPGGSSTGGIVVFTAGASDNAGILKVELYIDNLLVATDNAAPFNYVWDTRSISGSHTLKAKAFDTAGFTSEASKSVTVSNVPPTTRSFFTWYDFGQATTGLWFLDSAAGYEPRQEWYSRAGNWEWGRSKATVLDQDGDGMSEPVVFYDYGNANTGLFLFDPDTDYEPQRLWLSGAGGWEWGRTKVVTATDQIGDGITELAIMYDYGNDNTGLFIYDAGSGSMQRVWLSGWGNWSWSRSRIMTAADYDGDGETEIAVFYDYGNASCGIWLFEPGSWNAPHLVWFSAGWEYSRSKITVADQNSDGKAEIAVWYDYGNFTTGLWVFNPLTWSAPQRPWLSNAGGWEWARSKIVTATDQNGDGRTELVILYDYGNSNTGLILLDPASGYSFNRVWLSGAGGWDWSRSKPI